MVFGQHGCFTGYSVWKSLLTAKKKQLQIIAFFQIGWIFQKLLIKLNEISACYAIWYYCLKLAANIIKKSKKELFRSVDYIPCFALQHHRAGSITDLTIMKKMSSEIQSKKVRLNMLLA